MVVLDNLPDCAPAGLATLFDGIERELSTENNPEGIYRVLTDAAVRDVPGAEYAGISQSTAGPTGRLVTLAATDELVAVTDEIQYELNSGPCVDAIMQETVFNAADLRNDLRWPEFGRRAYETAGVVSMLSYRLYTEDHNGLVAAMNMYSTTPAAFGSESQTIGLLLATHGALAVAAATSREKARNLGQALENSREIGVAMGVLMIQHKITREQAFDLLRIASQHTHRKLADIASEVADTGSLALPVHAPADPRRLQHDGQNATHD